MPGLNTPPLRLPAREASAHKGNFGRVLLLGGSRGMSGSIALSSMAALLTGSGLVTAAVPDRCLETVASFHPAVMTVAMDDGGSGRFSLAAAAQLGPLLRTPDAVGCGPGMTTDVGSIRLVERLLQHKKTPRLLDADAINILSSIPWKTLHSPAPLVLTPHPGEFERLSGVRSGDRPAQIKAAAELAEQTGAVIVLKGGPTVVTAREGCWTNSTGNPGMATAGSGDTLTGVITSLLGQGMGAWDAARLGVWVHGAAGDRAAAQVGQPGLTAPDIAAALPRVLADLAAAS